MHIAMAFLGMVYIAVPIKQTLKFITEYRASFWCFYYANKLGTVLWACANTTSLVSFGNLMKMTHYLFINAMG